MKLPYPDNRNINGPINLIGCMSNPASRSISTALIMILTLIIFGGGVISGDENPDPVELVDHERLEIHGDPDIADHASSGSGSSGDPYIIKRLSINATGSVGISITNVTAHLKIRECLVYGGFFYGFKGIVIENCSDIEIIGCAVYYSHMGIDIVNSTGITVSDSFIGGSRNGINVSGTGCLIRNTTCKYNSMYGFTIIGGGGNRIENCKSDGNNGVLGDSGGIRIIDSHENVIAGCLCTVNYGDGIGIIKSADGPSPIGNIVTDCVSDYNVYGLYLGDTTDTQIRNCTFRSNNVGILSSLSEECTVRDTSMEKNEVGLKLVLTSRVLVMDSNISRNDEGIRIISSSQNVFRDNMISDNEERGIILTIEGNYGGISADNLFHQNIISRNGMDSRQIIDHGNNTSWDDGTSGNYWSDHQAPDDDGNGVVDLPRMVFGTGIVMDRYPLIGDFPEDVERIIEVPEEEPDEGSDPIFKYVLAVVVSLILIELAYIFIVKYRYQRRS